MTEEDVLDRCRNDTSGSNPAKGIVLNGSGLDEKEQGNLLRWDGSRRGWYEVYFLKWNDAASRTAGWVRYTLTSPLPGKGEPYCELWGIFFDVDEPEKNFAVKERFPIERFLFEKDRFELQVGQARLAQSACRGELRSADAEHHLAWDLTFTSGSPVFYLLPYRKMYQMAFPKTKVLCPHHDARFTGRVVADGREIDLKEARGQQEHLWGTQQGHRWAWGHCNTFEEDPGAVWEGLDAQIKLGPVASPHLKLFFLRAFGKEYRFNGMSRWFLNRSSWELPGWTFEARGPGVRLNGEVSCHPDELVGVTYTDTDGSQFWCNNTKVASIRLRLLGRGSTLQGELHSRKGAAAEFVDRKIHPLVPIRI